MLAVVFLYVYKFHTLYWTINVNKLLHRKLNIVHIYTPTAKKYDEEVECFYEDIKDILTQKKAQKILQLG